jgi:hypothetical protein
MTSHIPKRAHAACAGSILLLFFLAGDARSQGRDPTVVTNLRILQQDAPVSNLRHKTAGQVWARALPPSAEYLFE